MTSSKQLYVSVFEVKPSLVAGRAEYVVVTDDVAACFSPSPREKGAEAIAVPRLALETVGRLRAVQANVLWFRDFWDYDAIENHIADSAAILAVTDTGYFSSTGKLIELSYATGQRAHRREPVSPRKVFILPVDDAHNEFRHLETPGTWTVLEADPLAASEALLAALT